jgi:hypothetical protein
MAITSYGFDGTVSEAPWAAMWPFMGQVDAVGTAAAWKVTTVAAQDRTISIAAGDAATAGVYTSNTSALTYQLPTVASGSRWATIVRRVNWSDNTVTVLHVGQSTTQTVATLNSTPGTLYDQPLALVRVTAGVQVPDTVVDLRVTLDMARLGWGPWVPITQTGSLTDDATHGHTWSYRTSIPAGRVEIRGAVQAPFTATTITAVGSPLPAEAWPNRPQYFVGSCSYDSATQSWSARLYIDTAGQIYFFFPPTPTWLNFDGWVYDLA